MFLETTNSMTLWFTWKKWFKQGRALEMICIMVCRLQHTLPLSLFIYSQSSIKCSLSSSTVSLMSLSPGFERPEQVSFWLNVLSLGHDDRQLVLSVWRSLLFPSEPTKHHTSVVHFMSQIHRVSFLSGLHMTLWLWDFLLVVLNVRRSIQHSHVPVYTLLSLLSLCLSSACQHIARRLSGTLWCLQWPYYTTTI